MAANSRGNHLKRSITCFVTRGRVAHYSQIYVLDLSSCTLCWLLVTWRWCFKSFVAAIRVTDWRTMSWWDILNITWTEFALGRSVLVYGCHRLRGQTGARLCLVVRLLLSLPVSAHHHTQTHYHQWRNVLRLCYTPPVLLYSLPSGFFLVQKLVQWKYFVVRVLIISLDETSRSDRKKSVYSSELSVVVRTRGTDAAVVTVAIHCNVCS